MATREQAMLALFGLGKALKWGAPLLDSSGNQILDANQQPILDSGSAGFVFTMRRVKTPDQIGIGMMPAFCQGEYSASVEQLTGMPAKRTLSAAWFIYHYDGDEDAILATTTNNILDAIDAIFDPSIRGGPQTLGGLVHSARIEGEIEQYGGNIDGQVLLVVPIRIILP